MSQEKVDRYKEQKANRKQIMAKEKREKFLCIQVSHNCHHPSLMFDGRHYTEYLLACQAVL